jgi:nucleoside-diphosphate-sugar epimerase
MNILKNKPTILVTGSEGSLAQWIITNYLHDYNIIGVDNFQRYGSIDRERPYKFLKINLCNLNEVREVFQIHSIDYVFHCAAQIYGVKGSPKYPADILSNNTVSTSNILECCKEHQVKKIMYVSSSMVYEKSNVFPLKEEFTKDIGMPATAYGFSKLVGERLVQEYQNQYRIPYVIWRPFNIVTPNESSEDEPGIAHVMADFIQKIYIDRRDTIEIFGNGEQTRCFTWIDDIAKVIAAKSLLAETDNQIYNVGSEMPTKVIDLARLIFNKSNRSDEFKVEFVPIFEDDVKMRIPDCLNSRSVGFVHTKTIEELVDICMGKFYSSNE